MVVAESYLSDMLRREGSVLREVDVDLIDPPEDQLRVSLDPRALDELASSIRELGLLQPPGVREVGGRYVVVWGHRRTEAVRLLGWRRMSVFVVSGEADQNIARAAAENLERADLTPVEEAACVAELYARCGEDVDRVCRRVNRSRGWVEQRLRLRAWPPDLLDALHHGRISLGVAQELAAVSDEGHRRFLLGHAEGGGCTARTAQAWRIAWEMSGVVSDVTVAQVAPGRDPLPPVEAELPCMWCGGRHQYSKLTHVWLCADGLAALQAVRDEFQASGGDGPPA